MEENQMPTKLKPEEVPALNYVPMPEMKDELVLMAVAPNPGPIFIFSEQNLVLAVPWSEIARYAIEHAADPTKPKEIKKLG